MEHKSPYWRFQKTFRLAVLGQNILPFYVILTDQIYHSLLGLVNTEVQTKRRLIGNIDLAQKCIKEEFKKTFSMSIFFSQAKHGVKVLYELCSLLIIVLLFVKVLHTNKFIAAVEFVNNLEKKYRKTLMLQNLLHVWCVVQFSQVCILRYRVPSSVS